MNVFAPDRLTPEAVAYMIGRVLDDPPGAAAYREELRPRLRVVHGLAYSTLDLFDPIWEWHRQQGRSAWEAVRFEFGTL